MPSIGNKATLVTSEECRRCAKCCKEFVCGGFDIECAVRFLWMEDGKIAPRDSALRDDVGNLKREIVFKFPCRYLEEQDGVFSCAVWNGVRPEFCNTFPDSVFYHIEEWDTQRLEKVRGELENDCPAAKHFTIEQIQEMLHRWRK